jgi:regulator of sigma E protease
MTIILFIAVLFFLILAHELGHFLTAKWARMRVDEFAIGFPPRLFSIKKKETEYSINLLPIGGYVKIFGENGVDATDGPRAFGSRPRYQQAIVLLAGVFMNILAAWVIFFAVAIIGTPTAVEEGSPGSEAAILTVTTVLPESPAASIPLGAKIAAMSSAGESLSRLTPSAFTEFVSRHSNDDINLVYSHKGKSSEVILKPESGIIDAEPDRKALGLATALVVTRNQSPTEALVGATIRTWDSLVAIAIGLVSFLGSAFTLSADIEQVTGPIGIAGMVGDAAEFGVVSLLIFTAFISLNLAVINLLPIPALDGGRLLFVVAEAIIRRPIDAEWMGRVNFIGFALLILLMIAVTYNDILKLF